VATHTLAHLRPWQDQFIISGIACLCVVAIALLFLRELSPELRDQLIVSEHERALVEARAMGIDVESATAHPLRSMIKWDLVAASAGISVFLLFYYASVSVLTIYWVVIFNRSTPQANGINVWYSAFLSGGLVIAGFVSDRLRVRKPFMLLGTLAAMVMLGLLIAQTDRPRTGYYGNVLVIVLLAVSIALAYAPWMASYTEQVESHNPALTATGLAIWGWVLRVTVALSFLVLPYVITTSTVLVNNQGAATALQAIQAAEPYAPSTTGCASAPVPPSVISSLRATDQAGPRTLAALLDGCNSTHNLLKAVAAAGGLSNPQIQGLLAYNPLAKAIQRGQPVGRAEIESKVAVHSQNLAYLLFAEQKLVPAQKHSPSEWKRWWTVCLVGQLVFGLLVFTMRGRWDPRAARRDFEERERMVTEELAKLGNQPVPVAQ